MSRVPRPPRPKAKPIPLAAPVPGKYRLRRRGTRVWVPAMIWRERPTDPDGMAIDRPMRLRCVVGGEEVDPDKVWTKLHPIDDAAYEMLVTQHAQAPEDIDLMTSEPRL